MNTAHISAFMIHCTTGCSCCSSENHYCGPFSSRDVAEKASASFHDGKKLASQYARNGRYSIEEHPAEVLPDGRVIIDCRIFKGWADESPWESIEYDLFASGR